MFLPVSQLSDRFNAWPDTSAVHSVQAFKSKYWIIYPTLVIGALVEVLGWAGRYWSSQNVTALDPFLMQICT